MGNRVELDQMGKQILQVIRNELFLNMHFMGAALNSLDFRMDLWTKTLGTDSVSLRFNPLYLYEVYLEHPYKLDRAYMHILMHCLFRHMFSADQFPDKDLWDLCCDIAAEAVVDSMDYPVINVVLTDYREAVYERLSEEVGLLTAERLYRYFTSRHRDYDEEARMAFEFWNDDHSFWERMEKQRIEDKNTAAPSNLSSEQQSDQQEEQAEAQSDRQDDPTDMSEQQENQQEEQTGTPKDQKNDPTEITPKQRNNRQDPDQENQGEVPPMLLRLHEVKEKMEEWEKNAKRLQTELETHGSRKGTENGTLMRVLAVENRTRTDYREFLQKFAVIREEPGIDLDSFDFGYYNYGMQMYGNMPLFEELEYREAKKVEELVIALDTSMSCQDTLIRKFLNDTAAVLSRAESFFRRIRIHIIECDEKVQKVILLESPADMEKYAEHFHIHGGGGTDFRPVFQYIENQQRLGEMTRVKGLMYFTDGFGVYPETPTLYETAFVFHREEEMDDAGVPDWALKLLVREDTPYEY